MVPFRLDQKDESDSAGSTSAAGPRRTDAITVARLEPGAASSSAPTSRGNVARVIAAVLAEPASIGRVIPFRDGDTPIAQAVADVPLAYADLS